MRVQSGNYNLCFSCCRTFNLTTAPLPPHPTRSSTITIPIQQNAATKLLASPLLYISHNTSVQASEIPNPTAAHALTYRHSTPSAQNVYRNTHPLPPVLPYPLPLAIILQRNRPLIPIPHHGPRVSPVQTQVQGCERERRVL
jgi:hypothetical protein